MDLVVALYEVVIISIQRPADEGDGISPDHSGMPVRLDSSQQLAGTGEMLSGGLSPGSAIRGGSGAPLFQFGCLSSIRMNKRFSALR